MLPAGWFAIGPRAESTTSTPSTAVERASRSVSSPLMRVMAEFCARSSGTFCGDLAKMTMLASVYTSSVFRTMRMPLGPVAPRIKKRMEDVERRGAKRTSLV